MKIAPRLLLLIHSRLSKHYATGERVEGDAAEDPHTGRRKNKAKNCLQLTLLLTVTANAIDRSFNIVLLLKRNPCPQCVLLSESVIFWRESKRREEEETRDWHIKSQWRKEENWEAMRLDEDSMRQSVLIASPLCSGGEKGESRAEP